MLKNGHPNPLNVHNLRQLDWCPPHFTSVIIDNTIPQKTLSDWLYENLDGRFYLGPIDVDATGENAKKFAVRKTQIAFEIPNEASYFGLFLPNLLKNAL